MQTPTTSPNHRFQPALRAFFPLAAALLFLCAVPRTSMAGWPTESATWLARGPHPAIHRSLHLEDVSRPTQAHGKFEGSPTRQFKAAVWYPGERRPLEPLRPGPVPCLEGARPLVIYSHGYMSFRTEGRYLAEHLASHGYVVLAANFPSTNYFAPGKPNLADVVNQPDDVKFLIDTALEWPDRDVGVGCKIDPSRIAAVGLSLGGMTSTLAAFHPTLRDPRIAAAVSIAGPTAMFDQKFFAHAETPFMMIAGDIDAIVDYAHNAANLLEKNPDAILVTLENASHTGFANIARVILGWKRNPDALGCKKLDDHMPEEGEFIEALGGEEDGIVVPADGLPCQTDTFPRALEPRRQQALTTLAVYSFLTLVMDPDPRRRLEARAFLADTFAEEISAVRVETVFW